MMVALNIGDPMIMIMTTQQVIVPEEKISMLLGATMLGMLLLLIMMLFSDSDNLDHSGDSARGGEQHATRSCHAWDGSRGGGGA